MSTQEIEKMMGIDWVSQNAKYIDFSKEAAARANEPDTEPESDTDYDTDDLPSDSEEEEEICPSCGEEWTDATRCDCPNEEEDGDCYKCDKTFKKDLDGWGATNLKGYGGINFCHDCWDGETGCEVENSVEGKDGDMYWTPGDEKLSIDQN